MSQKSSSSTFTMAGLACALLLLGACISINNFTPTSGPPGTKVTIEGSGFEPNATDNAVEFGGQAVPAGDILSGSSSKLKVKVPTGATTGVIKITKLDGKSATSDQNFVVKAGGAKWSFLVYLDGDNNLEDAGLDDFREMATAGSTADVNIIVQMDRIAGYTSADGNWTGTRRFVVQAGDDPGGTPIADLGEQNMGDPLVLQDFVEWGVTNYPAEHYALVIWNHGGGWRERIRGLEADFRTARARGEPPPEITRAVAWDDTDNDTLYMKEVQTALEGAKASIRARTGTAVKLDVVGYDACLMGMIEVAYAMRNVADYVVGSEDLEPFDGWPYDTILGALKLNPTMLGDDLAGVIVSEYADSYTGSTGITQSAVDLAELGDLVTEISDFTSVATSEWAMFKSARLASEEFPHSRGVDFRDFAARVASTASSAAIQAAAADLAAAVDTFVIAEEHSSDLSGAHGVAIYFPPTQSDYNADPDHLGYEESNTFYPVDFVNSTTWDNWLHDYHTQNP